MSGPFVCGMRKFDKHKMMTSDRPTNPALYQENQKSLNDLIRLREQQDNGVFSSSVITDRPIFEQPISTQSISTQHVSDQNYTPWKTPSTN